MAVRSYSKHYEDAAFIGTSAIQVFGYVDDCSRPFSRMSQSSWMMSESKFDKNHLLI